MKTLALLLAIISLLFLAQMGQAADLKAGWYANMSPVYIYTYDSNGLPTLRGSASFLTATGQYGPFAISDGPTHRQDKRFVSVSADTYAIGPDKSIVLPLGLGLYYGEMIAYLSIACETSYDPSNMVLEFWHQETDGSQAMLWSQPNGGLQYASAYLAQETNNAGSYFFRVSVVPEPSSLFTFAGAIFALACWKRNS